VGGPVAMGFDEEAACGRFEFHAKDFGALWCQEGKARKRQSR
jgi:hypothetical protein